MSTTVPAESLAPGMLVDDERFPSVLLVGHVRIGPKWVTAWAHHPEVNVYPNPGRRFARGSTVTIEVPMARLAPASVLAAHRDYLADGGTLALDDWLNDWEIRRSNTPGGLIGDPWPEGPGYHPATPLPGGGYD